MTALLDRTDLIEDVEFMMADREWPPRIAQRSHMQMEALYRALQRCGRYDLAKPFAAHIKEARH